MNTNLEGFLNDESYNQIILGLQKIKTYDLANYLNDEYRKHSPINSNFTAHLEEAAKRFNLPREVKHFIEQWCEEKNIEIVHSVFLSHNEILWKDNLHAGDIRTLKEQLKNYQDLANQEGLDPDIKSNCEQWIDSIRTRLNPIEIVETFDLLCESQERIITVKSILEKLHFIENKNGRYLWNSQKQPKDLSILIYALEDEHLINAGIRGVTLHRIFLNEFSCSISERSFRDDRIKLKYYRVSYPDPKIKSKVDSLINRIKAVF